MAHHGHGGVVLLAAQRHHAGVEAGHQLVQMLEVLGHGGLVGAEDPVRALEEVGAGAGDAALLGAGHGVSRHVARRGRQKLGGRGEDVALGGDGVGDDAGIAPVAQADEVVVHGGHGRGDDHELAIVLDEGAEGGIVGARGLVAPAALDSGGAGSGVRIHPEDARGGHLGGHRPGERRPDEAEAYDGHGREGGVGAVQFSRFSHGSVCFLNRSGTSRLPLYTKPPPPRPNTRQRRIFRTSLRLRNV